MSVTIQLRRDTASNWTSANPILADGEIGFETDTYLYKIGTGLTGWNGLPYTALRQVDDATVINFSNQSTPATPAADTGNVYIKDIAQRMFLRVQGPSGISTPLQTSFFQNNIVMINTSATTTVGSIGNTVTSTGTLSHPTPVPEYGYMTNFASAATTNATAGTGTNGTIFVRTTTATDAAGFFYYARLALTDSTYDQTTATTGSRIFVGLTNQTMAAMVGADNPTGTYCGFMRRSVNGAAQDTNWQFVTKDGTTLNAIDTTLVFAAQKVYDYYIFCPPGGAYVGWRIDNVTDGTTQEGSTTSNLPTADTYLRAGFQLATINATARNIRMQRVYIESDR